jgi:hypothetical protein
LKLSILDIPHHAVNELVAVRAGGHDFCDIPIISQRMAADVSRFESRTRFRNVYDSVVMALLAPTAAAIIRNDPDVVDVSCPVCQSKFTFVLAGPGKTVRNFIDPDFKLTLYV